MLAYSAYLWLTFSLGGWDHFSFNTKIQSSTAAAAEMWILNFAKYQYLFNIKIKNSTAVAVEFLMLLATIFYLIPKFKIRPRQRSKFEFLILLSIIIYINIYRFLRLFRIIIFLIGLPICFVNQLTTLLHIYIYIYIYIKSYILNHILYCTFENVLNIHIIFFIYHGSRTLVRQLRLAEQPRA